MKKRIRNRARRLPKRMRVHLGGVNFDVAVQHAWVDRDGDRWAVFSVDGNPTLAMEDDV
jgi:hypothetical protein